MERRVTDRGGNVGPEARRFRWIGIARTRGPDPPGTKQSCITLKCGRTKSTPTKLTVRRFSNAGDGDPARRATLTLGTWETAQPLPDQSKARPAGAVHPERLRPHRRRRGRALAADLGTEAHVLATGLDGGALGASVDP